MKTIFNTLSNTYRAMRLLSNPQVVEMIEERLQPEMEKGDKLGKGNAYFHKHYIVHITN